ncbi:MAG TPA: AMP-binding protein [Actinomycetota bacterium]|nr:AMP-binding protein [Actinomycetota bacterium]
MPTLPELADEHDALHGDYERLFFEGRWWSSFELSDQAKRFAGGLAGLGVEPGERVLVMLSNGPEVGTVYQGAWRAGAAVTPVLFLLQPHEVARVIREAEPSVVVAGPEFLPGIGASLEGSPAAPPRAIVTTGPPGDGEIGFADLVASSDPLDTPVAGTEDDLAALLFTGGTTGASKGVMLSHGNIAFDARQAAAAAEVGDDEVALTALPLAHSYGILVAAIGLFVKGRGVLQRWFEPLGFLQAIAEHRANRIAVVPTMLQYLLQAPLEDHDLSSLRFVASGAAALPQEVAREWERRTGSRVLEGYGCTEAMSAVAVTRPSDPPRPGSVGRPIEGCEVRIEDDDGAEVADGEPGEICVRGPNVMRGYWRQPDATEAVMAGGWLHTGDIGRRDANGFVYVVERKKDLIIRGGINVYPRDVEEVLAEHPAVAMAGVVGRPDELFGEEVVAFVVRRAGADATEDDLLAFAEERLSKPKRPKEIRFVPQLPLTPVGKVNRRELRAGV